MTAATEFPDGFEWSDEEERPVVTYYTAREVAEALGVVERSVRRWIEDGKLPAEKVGGAFRIRMEDARRVYSESRSGYREGDAGAAVSGRSRLAPAGSRKLAVAGVSGLGPPLRILRPSPRKV